MDLFTNFEILIMSSVVGGLVLIIMVLTLTEVISHHKEKKKDNNISGGGSDNSNKDEEEIEFLDVSEPVSTNLEPAPAVTQITTVEPQVEITSTKPMMVKVADLIEEKEEPLQVNNQVDNNLTEDVLVTKIEPIEELEMAPVEKAKEELLKLENELEHEPSLEDTITSIEAMEEESAIISYQELLSTTSKIEGLPLDDDGDEPISINELYEKFNGNQEELPKIETDFNVNDFEMEMYSGNTDAESLSEIQLENTANLEKLDKEIRKTNEFLHILNELKKNLD